MNTHVAYISAGSNIGDREATLESALASLAKQCAVNRISSFFETEPVGYLDQPWFLNMAVELETSLSPLELLVVCQGIESACGRIRTFPNAPRTLDLDILLFDAVRIHQENLIIPHPRLSERRFVLAPLAQIAPGLLHPTLNKTIRELLLECPDPSRVIEKVAPHASGCRE